MPRGMLMKTASTTRHGLVALALLAQCRAFHRFSSLSHPRTFLQLRAEGDKDASMPSTFPQAISDTYQAITAAEEKGFNLLEVEFPPLSTDVLESPECSAQDVSRANLRLAIDLAKKFVQFSNKKVTITLPDQAEADRAIEDEGTANPFPGVTIRALTETTEASSPFANFFSFGKGRGEVKPVPGTDVYILCVFSCQELPQLEELANLDPGKTIVFFNLKLETLRGDLGLPAFPGKELQYRFLSKVLPVYFLRVRSYSKSITKAPFLVNYQGALFRVFPGSWQSMLDVGRGRYKRVAISETRPGLGQFKVQLGEALDLGDEGNVNSFFRQGFKTSTWWEDATDKEESTVWRQ